MNKLIRYFHSVDLRNSHNGLSFIAKKHGIDTRKLGQGEFIAFTNRAQTKIKLYAGGDVIAYLRVSKGRIDPRVIQNLPKHFNGGSINYDLAIEDTLKKQFPAWFEKQTNQLKSKRIVSKQIITY